MKRTLLLLVVVLSMGPLLHPAPGRADEPLRMLVIRPQRLPQAATRAVANGSQRDPFSWPAGFLDRVRPLNPEGNREAFAGLTLQSVIWDRNNPQAIINGNLVGVGDAVDGAVVKRIDKDSVLLAKDGYRHRLEFVDNVLDLSQSASEAP